MIVTRKDGSSIFFSDACDYAEIAQALIHQMAKTFPDLFAFDETTEDITAIAEILAETLEPEIIMRFLDTALGQGILIGVVTAEYGKQVQLQSAKDDEEDEEGP